MKQYLKRFAIMFTITNMVFLIVALSILRNLDINYPFITLSIGNILVSIFVSLSWTIFKMEKGNAIIKTILGFITLLPVTLVCLNVFGMLVFRYSFVIYVFGIICTIIYGVVVFAVSYKSKKQEKELNNLLNKDDKKDIK